MDWRSANWSVKRITLFASSKDHQVVALLLQSGPLDLHPPLDAATPNKRESIWKFSISSWRKLSYNFAWDIFILNLVSPMDFWLLLRMMIFFRNQTTEWFEREPSFYTVWKRSKWCYYQTNSQNDIKLWTYSKSNQAFCL